MRKDDITRLFPEATDEQIKTLLDINSADITHALDKRRGENDRLQSDLDAANARRSFQSFGSLATFVRRSSSNIHIHFPLKAR